MTRPTNGTMKRIGGYIGAFIVAGGVLVWLGNNYFQTRQAAAEAAKDTAIVTSAIQGAVKEQSIQLSTATKLLERLSDEHDKRTQLFIEMQIGMRNVAETVKEIQRDANERVRLFATFQQQMVFVTQAVTDLKAELSRYEHEDKPK